MAMVDAWHKLELSADAVVTLQLPMDRTQVAGRHTLTVDVPEDILDRREETDEAWSVEAWIDMSGFLHYRTIEDKLAVAWPRIVPLAARRPNTSFLVISLICDDRFALEIARWHSRLSWGREGVPRRRVKAKRGL